MKTLLIGLAAAGLVGVTTARAEEQGSSQTQSPSSGSSMSQTPSTQTPSSQTLPSSQTPSSQTPSSQAPSSATGATATASNELSGVVKKVDKDKRSLKISSPTGGEQDLKVADSATITRDGSKAGLDQIKEGDQVRASFDASGNQASSIEVNSKQKVKADDKSDAKPQSKY